MTKRVEDKRRKYKSLIACSHRRHGQGETVLSCLVLVGGVNTITLAKDKTVLSRLDPILMSFVINFSSRYVFWGLASCNTSNIVYYTAILCHKRVLLVLVRLIAIINFNCAINRD